MIYIKSNENAVIKHINSLKKRSYREKTGEFIIEGERGVRDAVKNGAEFSAVLIRSGYEGFVPACEKCYEAEPRLFDKVAETETPQGIIATAKINFKSIGEISCGMVVICDNLRDPGNMGTIIRTAHAVNASAIVLTKGCADPYAPKTVRATMGSVFKVPLVTMETIEEMDRLKEKGYKIIGGGLTGDAVNLFDADIKGNCAFVLGNEANGISQEVMSKCDMIVKIPMPGGLESLNASVAGALMMYEYLRKN